MEHDTHSLRRQTLHHNRSAGERRVPAQGHLDRRRKPAQPVILAVRHEEGRLSQIVLGRDRLERDIVDEAIKQHDGSRISGKAPVRKGIELVEGNEQDLLSETGDKDKL